MEIPGKEQFFEAKARVQQHAHRTPVLTSSTLNDLWGGQFYFKCENLQKIGAFKFRGAVNKIFSLPPALLAKGVATASSGNHAQAVALAARMKGVPAYIVMPENAPQVKVAAVKGYGAIITLCEPTLEARYATLDKVIAETGAALVHAFDDDEIICGQGTAAMELIEDIPDLDILMAPVGGGGLISGTALAAHYFSPHTAVIGAEPSLADDATRGFKSGQWQPSNDPKTIADGLLTSLGKKNFAIIRQHLTDMVTADEESIIRTMFLIWERMKIVIEPSSAVPVAAIASGKVNVKGKKVGIILSGGNVDLRNLPWMSKSV